MKVIKNDDSLKGENSEKCKTSEYSFGDKDIDLGLVIHHGQKNNISV